MSGVLDYTPDESEAIAEARDERLTDLSVLRTELAGEDGEGERGWIACECGARSPNVCCPHCRARLRPPGSAGEVRWLRNHGFTPTATDLRRFPD